MKNEIEDYSLSEIFAQAKAIQDKKETDAEKLPAMFDKVLDALVDTSEKLNALTARHSELQNLVTSEIADFFAGQEQPGEAVGAEAQHKALMARVVACFDEKILEACESQRSKVLHQPLLPDDVAYPVDIFLELIRGNSPYAFYLFQWVPYQTDAKQWRLKMCHDVKTFDGREEHGIWPNGSHCGSFHDSEVEFIRISQKQFFEEWQDPREQSNQGGENL
ncbi:hypothetical protein [Shewanella algae]|uniref:hypothetical protein n=1 Tax=Shewanella algae TaxID=38313 RepID=UPI001BF0E153|nr:hypothetical protein [Shewanella algae]BCV49609.1 hypothetical protein TUM17382_23020 [Shewanella algae]